MKCSFCGTEAGKIFTYPNKKIHLCDECKGFYEQIQDQAESEEIPQQPKDIPGILCAIYAIMDTDKNLSYRVEGSDVDLPRLEGLVDYLKRVIDKLYMDKR